MTSSNQPLPGGMAARGAVDLAAVAQAREQQRQAAERAAHGVPTSGATIIDVTTADFQTEVIDRSFQAPVVIDLWATWCGPCKQLSPILEKLAVEAGGRWILAKVDVDAEPQIAQAFQVQSVPTVVAIIKGQPVPMFQGAVPEQQLRTILDELIKVAAENGVAAEVADGAPEPEEDDLDDPLYDAASDAFDAGDWDGAVAAYEQILAANPADQDAHVGLARVRLMKRMEGLDAAEMESAAADPTDVSQVCRAADFEMAAGNETAAFNLLINSVRVTTGDDRSVVKDHLLELFTLLPANDPAVARARGQLANALF